MELLNPTPLPGLAFRQFDQNGALDCIVALRGTCAHVQDGVAAWQDEQIPVQWQDAYDGDPFETPLLYQGDLVPEKTGTDVTFLGDSHAPASNTTEWTCGIEVGPVRKFLHISGPLQFLPDIRPARWPLKSEDEITGWRAEKAKPTKNVPMDWRFAAGGKPAFGDAPPDPQNPIGTGRIGPRADWRAEPVTAPQIGSQAGPTPDDDPAGLSPIPPFWPQRYRYAGTYDDAWQNERHPLLPEDFDPRFWNCAPEDQIARPFLRGDETYRLTNLHPDHPLATGRLPGFALSVRVDGQVRPMVLDGVQFDWRDTALILLTWRTRFPLPEAQGVQLQVDWHWLNREDDA